MNNTNISMFEAATRKKLRFVSTRGELSVEQLWDVPLRSEDNFNLDVIARAVNKGLKAIAEESFVATRKNPALGQQELKLSIIKHVIATKLDDEATVRSRASKAQEKTRLLDILAGKEASELGELSKEDLETRIRALEA